MHDDHDRGLLFDLQTMRRRQLLGLMAAGGGALMLQGCGGSGDSGGASTTTAATTTTTTGTGTTGGTTTDAACVTTPVETNGPYPADGSNMANGVLSNILTTSGVLRSDIRSSFAGLSGAAAGVPLTLTVNLVNVNGACAALADYAIYVWHADALGRYSVYDLPQENYLRGVQTTNANGQATFTTVFPGCYAGRYPHIHFEVFRSLATATAYANRALVSQFAMPAAACQSVYAGAAYGQSAQRFAQTSLTTDGIFADNTAAEVASMTIATSGEPAAGYTGSVTVGLAL